MLRRIALLLRISRHTDRLHGVLSISDLETARELPVQPNVFVLTLEHESDETFARGQFRSLRDQTDYPVQGNAALFEALSDYVTRGKDGP